MKYKIDGVNIKYECVIVTFKNGKVKVYSYVKDTYVVANTFYQIHALLIDGKRTRIISIRLDDISMIEENTY